MLERLVRRGYVFRNASDRYELTLKLFGLAHFHRPIRRLVSQATPLMSALATRTMQANHLAVYDRAGVTVIAQMDAPSYWGIAIRVGARVGLFNTGSGHVLLAFRSAEERAVMIAEQEAGDEEQARPGRPRGAAHADPPARLRGHAEPADSRRLQPVRAGAGRRQHRARRAHLPLYRAAQSPEGAGHPREPSRCCRRPPPPSRCAFAARSTPSRKPEGA